MVSVGVLALQGAVARHLAALQSLGVHAQAVRRAEELQRCDALIIPGGESTAIVKHICEEGLRESLCSFAEEKPLFGTCAGLILMAQVVVDATFTPLGLLDIEVKRIGYGRQADSFAAPLDVACCRQHSFHGVFIRAPRIKACGKKVNVLAEWNGEPVLVQQHHHLAASFHPELTDNVAIHRHFLSLISLQVSMY